jgi:hypothetical protein
MERKSNISAYLGALMILVGSVFLLELNGILPKTFIKEIFNIGLGLFLFILYAKNKRFYWVMLATFFTTNGCLHLLDSLLPGYNYWIGVFLIPGVMLLVAYMIQKKTPYLVPGSLLFFWGIYGLGITVGAFRSFTDVVGMFFIATAVAFMVMYMTLKQTWAMAVFIPIGILGLFIFILGLGPVVRNLLLQVVAIGVILAGFFLIIKQKINAIRFKKLEQKNTHKEDDL